LAEYIIEKSNAKNNKNALKQVRSNCCSWRNSLSNDKKTNT